MPTLPVSSDPARRSRVDNAGVEKPTDPGGLILEAWAEGYMVGSLIIMGAITVANMRRGVLLHKLILLELILGCFMGTFIFTDPPVYSWYLSATAVPLNISWCLHNVISWMKIKPFLSKRWSRIFIITVVMSFPYWVIEITANFTFFNDINDWFLTTRPYEALFRDPWWIATTVYLFYQIAAHYRIKLTTLVWISPRFGVLLLAMLLSIIFIVLDLLSVTHVFDSALPDGLNPFWKLSTVFKCLTDSIVLDDFKTALDRLMRHKMRREGMARQGLGADAQFGTIGSPSLHVVSQDGTSDAFSQWTSPYSAGEPALRHEDPLGEDSMERRMTSDTTQLMMDLDKVRTTSSTAQSDPLAEEIAAHPAPRRGAGLGVIQPSLAHVEHYDNIQLPGMLSERPNKAPS